MSAVESERQRQMREAEELLGSEQRRGFAKSLFFGRWDADLALPYPTLAPEQQEDLDGFLARVREFLHREIDSAVIDREATIPRSVIDGLFDLGVMTMSIP